MQESKRAIITGINGQDGSYLAETLLDKGYEVWGTVKRNSVAENQTSRLDTTYDRIKHNLQYVDMTDLASLIRIVKEAQPDEIYNLAAQSHVRISFDQPIYTVNTTGVGSLNLLEAVRMVKPDTKVYQASSSEMFGNQLDADGFQRETTQMHPVSPYGCAKVFAYNISRNYRNSYDMFISNGILFNHESPRRGSNFVSNKIVKTAVEIQKGLRDELRLGNLKATRDWGHAKDYVEAMWIILQQEKPDDFVCATGISHSVGDMVEYVFGKLGMDWTQYVKKDPKYFRPEELEDLKGDSSKLRNLTGWQPKYSFESLLDEMIEFWKTEL
jgi:GDPmannose 4,6-dehydratase